MELPSQNGSLIKLQTKRLVQKIIGCSWYDYFKTRLIDNQTIRLERKALERGHQTLKAEY